MKALFDLARRLFRRDRGGDISTGVLPSYKSLYKGFRSLLTANNNALETMAEMELTLASGQPFSMAFVRGNCTAVTVNVFKMVRQLQLLSAGKYGNLTEIFNGISGRLEEILEAQPPQPAGDFILPMAEIDRKAADATGQKMANLGEIKNHIGLKVPEGFAITTAATIHFIRESHLQDEINRRLKTLDHENIEALYATSAAIQKLISEAPLPVDLDAAITAAYKELAAGGAILVSMRSSAVGEDSGIASFAGQYRTQLHVTEEDLCQIYKEIVASKYKSQAIVYRLQRGFRHQDVTMSVGCLIMVDAVVSGVTYSRSPEDPRSDYVVINATWGLADQVVDGSKQTDLFHVARQSPNEIIAHKATDRIEEVSRAPGMAQERPQAGADPTRPVLTAEQAAELTRIAVKLENHFGSPQDIEWSIDRQGELVILQSRPLGRHALLDHDLPTYRPDGGSVAGARGKALLQGGITASRGVACGPVHIVRCDADLPAFPKGGVLVVAHPLPDWASLLNHAAAVVSETGEVAAHLATVSREFAIPALFGLAGATTSLTQGTVVTVDATGRAVYNGRVEALLAEIAPTVNLMAGSPVYKLLNNALTLIAPLNLTDPASPYFSPSACSTFHDLTRFCHEKAVAEMFALGDRCCNQDDKTARQLVGETPFKWWVIDLDDGFLPEVDPHGKFINISDIVSKPMHAIWAGMTAIPWAGPPPVNLRGFGSILFQSTMKPHLDPAVRSSMTTKNYFLVARNFCNLSVRLGYHFSLVEAYLSNLLTENYVSFQFKGGAADVGRREIRILLLKEILEEYDFRVEQKVDSLTARIEKKPEEYLMERLQVLGYLLIHTRQIDMVMGEADMVANYRWKLRDDLNTILGKNGATP